MDEVSAQQYMNYGNSRAERSDMPFRERLRTYYKENDFVTVMNIDTEPLTYTYADPSDFEVIQPSPYTREVHPKRAPHTVTLQPGERKLCPAFEADLMIMNLIKKLTSQTVADQIAKGLRREGTAANWNDPETLKDYIGKIFLGTEDVLNRYNAPQAVKEEIQNDVAKDLESEPTERPTRGRPRTAQ